jgi:hypothetical protein
VPGVAAFGAQLPLMPVTGGGTSEQSDNPPEKPRGRVVVYWGCSATVKPGQPYLFDAAKASQQDYVNFISGRHSRSRGAAATPGNSIWPNDQSRSRIPKTSSLQGDHSVAGDVPPSLKFAISQQQDFMPPLGLNSAGALSGSVTLAWRSLPTARGYMLTAFATKGEDMIIWSASEPRDPGWGIMDYASNAQVDTWIRDKAALPPSASNCAIPAGIFAGAESVVAQGIAYGNELNLSHPPRPNNAPASWQPEWAAKIRVKSHEMIALDEEQRGSRGRNAGAQQGGQQSGQQGNQQGGQQEGRQGGLPGFGVPGVGDALKGIFGR